MPKKLLIADDSITIQKVMTITFPSRDYELVIVGNGDDAIKKSLEVKPDLVIADIGMPGKNGYEVCETIKKTPELKNVPVLLLSGAFEPFDANRAKAVGADDYIVKPFETQALINKVNELLQKSAQVSETEEKPVEAEIEESLSAELGEVVETGRAEEVAEEAVAEAVPEAEEAIEEAVEAVEAEEVKEAPSEVVSAKAAEEQAPEDLWSMEGFEGVEEKAESKPAEAPEAIEVQEEVAEEPIREIGGEMPEAVEAGEEEIVPLAEEFGAEPVSQEEAIPVEEFEEGITFEEVKEAEPVAEMQEELAPQAPLESEEVVAEAKQLPEEMVQKTEVKEVISKEEISREIEKQVSEVLARLLPRLVEKITEEVVGSIARGFVKEAIERSNIHEVTRKMIEDELKKSHKNQ